MNKNTKVFIKSVLIAGAIEVEFPNIIGFPEDCQTRKLVINLTAGLFQSIYT